MNGSSIMRRLNHRLTVTIGHDSIVRARWTRSVNGAGTASNRSGSANQGTAEMTRFADQCSPFAVTVMRESLSTRSLAAALMRTVPPCLSTYRRAGSAYIRCSGLVGSTMAAARGSLPNISPSTRANAGAAARSGG